MDKKPYVQFKVYIPEETRNKIRDKAKKELTQMSDIARKIFDEYFEFEDTTSRIIKIIKDTITQEMKDASSINQLQVLTEAVEATIDFVRTESMGIEQATEIKMLNVMINLLWVIGNSLDLPHGALIDVALARLIESNLVKRSNVGVFLLTGPEDRVKS